MCQIESPFAMALLDETEEIPLEATEGVFEIKFLLPKDPAQELIACARQFLAPDPHAYAEEGDGYAVYSLYFDDDRFMTYLSAGVERLPKYRIRRYGEGNTLFLERKSKPEGKVKKHRTAVQAEELTYLEATEPPSEWSGRWFHKRLRKRGLRPVCFISYKRLARLGQMEGQYVRFTLDREIYCTPASQLGIPGPLQEQATPINIVIAEIKFEHSLPTAFAEVISKYKLTPVQVSKYKWGVEACSLVPLPLEESLNRGELGSSVDGNH